ncbi:MAG: GHKL domain-containing protein [Dysgonamonadaceae bacterium]|jgi:nitrogen fixation/metabolism regulation signal transduction histidine kinase|nr:GHKL domain-containing protein [Dysgonamonadaceae bacterium]
MKSKYIFRALAFVVFGALIFLGFPYKETHPDMFYLSEGVALLAIILFIILYRRLIRPYKIIADGMDLLKEQDFSTHLRLISDSEANKLIIVFNKMIDSLKEERMQVREKNLFLDLLIQASPQGLIILDFDDYITDINPSGLKLLNVPDKKDLIGKKIKDTDINISSSLSKLQHGDEIVVRESGMKTYRYVRSSFIDKGFKHPFFLIEELTDELLKIEKKSYEGVIRMMAHEVNNSIGAISSTLSVVSDIFREEDIDRKFSYVLPAVTASLERCRHLGKFIRNFAQVIKLPEPHKTNVDLNELAKLAEALTRIECQRRNIKLELQLSDKECMAFVDAIQIEQVLVNIIKNAYEAIEEEGIIKIATQSVPLLISISNNGPELTEEVKQNLFVPFFTTKNSGQGIGLMIVREILKNHQLFFSFYSESGWTKFDIRLGNE